MGWLHGRQRFCLKLRAYGKRHTSLANTVTMLATSIITYTYLCHQKAYVGGNSVSIIFFGAIEAMFSSLTKFFHGGYFTVLMAIRNLCCHVCMASWFTAIERTQAFIFLLINTSTSFATNTIQIFQLLLITWSSILMIHQRLDARHHYSILDKRPKAR